MFRNLWLLFFFCFLSKISFAQDAVAEKMHLNNLINTPAKLFVHFDKNVYSSNEMVWFTAYLLQEQKELVGEHKILSVSLIKNSDSSIVLQEKFVMGEGLSFGNLTLPNLLPNGDYHFMVFTNRVVKSKPVVVFVQPITLITNVLSNIRANIQFQKPPSPTDTIANFLLNVTTSDSRFLPKPALVNYKLGSFNGQGKTDASGQLVINVPFSAVKKDTVVNITVKSEKDSATLKIAMPIFKRKANVIFYPEGGYAIENIPGYVAFEIKDSFGSPLQLSGILFKDGEPIDTLQSNYYGMGKFIFAPQTNSNYTFKPIGKNIADSIYNLPKAIGKGTSIVVREAVVTDTLSLSLRSNQTGLHYLRLHNFRESFVYTPLIIKNAQSLKIPLHNLPKGLFTITLSDSLGRPMADRMAFAHYDIKEKITIATDKQIYRPREKVNLTLKLDSGVTEGVFSIAVVQESRLSSKNRTDIESYAYLNSEIGSLPLNAIGNAYKDKAFVEDILRVKGWSKYTWLALENVNPKDSIKNYDPMEITGTVTRNGKLLDKPTTLGITIDTLFTLLPTTNNGSFVLPMDNLIAESGKKAYAFLNGTNKEIAKIRINDPFLAVANNNILNSWPAYASQPIISDNYLKQISEQRILLNEVVIKGGKDNEYLGEMKNGPNACGDYVCNYGFLNCPIHFGGTIPIKDRTYALHDKTNEKGYILYKYKGCEKDQVKNWLNPIPIINTNKIFYVDGYKDNQEPAIFSTLYWQHYVKLNNISVDLNFYTGDILGKFNIIVQGVVDYNFFSQIVEFKVINK